MLFDIPGRVASLLVSTGYDNACHARRTIAKKLRHATKRLRAVPEQWQALADLIWALDKLHLQYHQGCLSEGAYHVPGVNPYDHIFLDHVNTQGAEQTFSMIDRWVKVLRWVGMNKHHLLLWLMAEWHNDRLDAERSWRSYEGRLKQGAC